MTDQWRWDWLGIHGTTGVETPNLDRLAGRGMRFTHAIVPTPLCAPSRIGMATGRRPFAIDCLTNEDVLPVGQPTFHQSFRDGGYRVGLVGQTDYSKPLRDIGQTGDRPKLFEWGFTHPFELEGKMHASGFAEGRPVGPYGHWLAESGLFQRFHDDYAERLGAVYTAMFDADSVYDGGEFCRDSVLPIQAFEDVWLGRHAVEWIERVPDDAPWQLFVSFAGPHDPFDPPTEYAERFREAPMPEPIRGTLHGKAPYMASDRWGQDHEQVAVARRQYTAACALVDDQVGLMLAALDRRGMTGDTIVVFTSDHGEMLGDHERFQKSVPYEAAIRVPLIVAGPGVETGVTDTLVDLIDVGPTLLDLADLPVLPAVEGRSFAPTLADPSIRHHDAVPIVDSHFEALRTETHKYVLTYRHAGADGGPGPDGHREGKGGAAGALEELYDLVSDPDERNNLVDHETELAGHLRDQLDAMLEP